MQAHQMAPVAYSHQKKQMTLAGNQTSVVSSKSRYAATALPAYCHQFKESLNGWVRPLATPDQLSAPAAAEVATSASAYEYGFVAPTSRHLLLLLHLAWAASSLLSAVQHGQQAEAVGSFWKTCSDDR
jgi:hypothetical protein